MSKRRLQFVQPWPFPVIDYGAMDNYRRLAHAALEMRKRYRRVAAYRPWQHATDIGRRGARIERNMLAEYYAINDSLIKRRLLREAVDFAGGSGSPRVRPFVVAFDTIWSQFSLRVSDPEERRILKLVRRGMLQYRPAEAEAMSEICSSFVRRVERRLCRIEKNRFSFDRVLPPCADIHAEVEPAIAFIRLLTEQEQFTLCDPAMGIEVLETAMTGQIAEGPLSSDRLAADSGSAEDLWKEIEEVCGGIHELDEMREAVFYHVEAPLCQWEPEDSRGALFLPLMANLLRASYREALLEGRAKLNSDCPVPDHQAAKIFAHEGMTALCLGASCEFWYVTLFEILVSVGGVNGKELADWVLPLLQYMTEHPSRLREYRGCRASQHAASVLKRYLAPYLRGFSEPDLATEISVATLRKASGREILNRYSQYFMLATVPEELDGEPVFRRADQQDTIAKLWDLIVGPNAERILLQCARDVLGRQATDTSFLSHMPDPMAPDAAPVTAPVVVEPDIPSEQDIEVDEGLGAKLIYVPNPGRSSSKRTIFRGGKRAVAAEMDEFFRQDHVSTLIKSESVVSALEHFDSLPDSVVRLMPKENINGEKWVKMKRGRSRILGRRNEEGEVEFHVYPRKDWAYNMFQ